MNQKPMQAGLPACRVIFRFSVKIAALEITHDRKLIDCTEPLARFLDDISHLGDKLGPVLVQLPPSFGL